jgi:hypothetical protein
MRCSSILPVLAALFMSGCSRDPQKQQIFRPAQTIALRLPCAGERVRIGPPRNALSDRLLEGGTTHDT